MLSLLYLDEREVIYDNYTVQLRDRVTGHGVFQYVLLSLVTLDKILWFGSENFIQL